MSIGTRTRTITRTAAILAVALVIGAAATVVLAMSFVVQEVQAVKGEAATHISPQGAANQSPQGGSSSTCGRACG